MERFSIESEVDMKIRQAKKIMKQVYKIDIGHIGKAIIVARRMQES